MEFREWPKIPRWTEESYTFTEKIDGTNACIIITEDGQIAAQSRSRLIVPGDDNYGFALWVETHKDKLMQLGVGYHFGEWWGKGIQRNYGMDDKIFSLFDPWFPEELRPSCVGKVPVIGQDLQQSLKRLKENGSIAAPGYDKPEGLIIWSKLHRKILYKYLLD